MEIPLWWDCDGVRFPLTLRSRTPGWKCAAVEPLVPERDKGSFSRAPASEANDHGSTSGRSESALERAAASSLGSPARGNRSFSSFTRNIRLTSPRTFRIFHLPRRCPGPIFPASKTREQSRASTLEVTLEAAPKKVLDFKGNSRETGNPPLDGTGSLKTEQRRTHEGGRKSSPRGDLRDSFEGLVRRDEPGSASRWFVGLHR